jgi:hypothetical protein
MMMPTAMSTTLPRIANSLNSLNIFSVSFFRDVSVAPVGDVGDAVRDSESRYLEAPQH